MRTRTKYTLMATAIILISSFAAHWQSQQVDNIIEMMDFDRNGVLQLEEVQPLMRMRFDELDTDASGGLNRGEIARYVRKSIADGIARKWQTKGLPEYPDAGAIDKMAMQAALDEMVEVLELPGAVMLFGRDGVEQLRITSGEFNSGTVVPVASASKWVTSTVLMRLVEQGVLTLDSPLDRYVPELRGHWAKTTLEQLLNFSSGVGEGHASEHVPSTPYKEQFKHLINTPVHNLPGAEFTYGGISMQIAGYVAEQASGKPWAQLFEELVAAPAAMKNSSYGHPLWHKPGTPVKSPNLAGGLYTTAQDYFNFLTAIHLSTTGAGLLTEDSVNQMETNRTSALIQNFRPPIVREDWFYGLGLWCEAPLPEGCTYVNSAGAFGAFPWMNRASRTYGLLITLGPMPEVLPFALNLRRMANKVVQPPH